MIDMKTQEIKAASDETYSDMRDVGDELPDSSPRFILLSHPLTLVSHGLKIPLAAAHRFPRWQRPMIRKNVSLIPGDDIEVISSKCTMESLFMERHANSGSLLDVFPCHMFSFTIYLKIATRTSVCPTPELSN